jgi:hypothetical protein
MPTNIQVAIHRNKKVAVYFDEQLWAGALDYALKDLQIEYLRARIDCLFIPVSMERKVKFKYFSAGASGVTPVGAMFYVVAERFLTNGSMVRTFFHEMTHVKQVLMRELIVKPRHFVWKKEKWDRREYSFAPWEEEARAFADKPYLAFLRQQVTRLMADESVHAYHPALLRLKAMYPEDEVYQVTRELHRDRGNRQSSISN